MQTVLLSENISLLLFLTVPIESIKEIRVGKNTEVLRTRDLSSGHTEDCAFSILYGDDFESLDLVASTPEEANIWVTGLNALVGAHKCEYIYRLYYGLCTEMSSPKSEE
jgi:hypothetical protein